MMRSMFVAILLFCSAANSWGADLTLACAAIAKKTGSDTDFTSMAAGELISVFYISEEQSIIRVRFKFFNKKFYDSYFRILLNLGNISREEAKGSIVLEGDQILFLNFSKETGTLRVEQVFSASKKSAATQIIYNCVGTGF